MYLPCTWVRNLSQVGAQAAADRGAEAGRRAPQKGCPPALTSRGPLLRPSAQPKPVKFSSTRPWYPVTAARSTSVRIARVSSGV